MTGVSDQTISRRTLGYAPKYDLVAGLRDLADWMKTRG
jgi:nucleoside-diphosphate-sugar epimerase